MKHLLFSGMVGILLSVPAFGAPVPCIVSSFTSSGSQWWSEVALKLTNNCDTPLNFQNAKITFESTSNIDANVWGDFAPLTYPDNALFVSSQSIGGGRFLSSISLHFPVESWANKTLPNGRSITLKFGSPSPGYVAGTVKVDLEGSIPSPSPSPKPSPSPSPSPKPSPSPSPSPKPSPSPSPKPSPSPSPKPSPSPSPTLTPSPTPSSSPSPTPSTDPMSTAGFCSNRNIRVSVAPHALPTTPLDSMGKLMVGYFSSWFDRGVHPGEHMQTQLANVASYVNVVNIAFMRPDGKYVKGSLDLGPTGITYASKGIVFRDAIAALKAKGTRVIISVGGATYHNWANLNVQAIKDVITDFNMDGVDIDFEESPTNCTWAYGGQSCASDAGFIKTIRNLRAALPRPQIVSMAVWSIGAYGQGPFVCDTPMADRTGLLINPLLQAGDDVDLINVMSYDAGPYNMGTPKPSDHQGNPAFYYPLRAMQAYQQIYSGHIVGGIEVPYESWGGNVVKIPQIQQFGTFVLNNRMSGLMFWSLQGSGNAPGPLTPQQVGTEICNSLKLQNCSSPLLGGR